MQTRIQADIPPDVPRLLLACQSSREADPSILRAAEDLCKVRTLTSNRVSVVPGRFCSRPCFFFFFSGRYGAGAFQYQARSGRTAGVPDTYAAFSFCRRASAVVFPTGVDNTSGESLSEIVHRVTPAGA